MKPLSGVERPDTAETAGGTTSAGADEGRLRAAGARLPIPPAGWREHSACSHADHDLFVGELTPDQEARAKAICEQCQVQDACLAFSITHEVQYGVWAG
ncbi:MAG: WhiB family transcriptional regulator [Acidimicrobiia bacterium]